MSVTRVLVVGSGVAAAEQAAVAQTIAARAGAIAAAEPFRRVLRGLLMTGDGPLYLLDGAASSDPLWSPPPVRLR